MSTPLDFSYSFIISFSGFTHTFIFGSLNGIVARRSLFFTIDKK